MNERMLEILKSKFCQIETGESIYRYDLIVGGLGYLNTTTSTRLNDDSEREIDAKNVMQLLNLWIKCRANPNLAPYKISHGYKIPDLLNGTYLVRLPENELDKEIKEMMIENKMRKIEEMFA
jgi:hypothetical protein